MIGKLFFDKKGDALQKCISYIPMVKRPVEIHLSSRDEFTGEQIRIASEYCRGRGVTLVISKTIAPHNIFVVRGTDDSKSVFEKASERDFVL